MRGWSAVIGLAVASVSVGAAPTTIEGPVWQLTRLRGTDEHALTVLRPPVTVRFEGGSVQGFGGCNRLVGSYTVAADRITISALAGTMMACPAPVMAIEDAFKKALAGTLHFSVADGRLTLAEDADADPTLVFAAAPPPRIEGVVWEVSGFNNGRHAVVSPLTGTTLTLAFRDGSVVGSAGCNTFRASYTLEGDRLTIGPPAATRKHCDGTGVMQQEGEFLAALESATTWAIDLELLDLHRADGERVLLANPAAK